MALAEMGFGLNGYWPNWELDQVALDEMVLDEMGLDQVAIPRNDQMQSKMVRSNTKNTKTRVRQYQVCCLRTTYSSVPKTEALIDIAIQIIYMLNNTFKLQKPKIGLCPWSKSHKRFIHNAEILTI